MPDHLDERTAEMGRLSERLTNLRNSVEREDLDQHERDRLRKELEVLPYEMDDRAEIWLQLYQPETRFAECLGLDRRIAKLQAQCRNLVVGVGY